MNLKATIAGILVIIFMIMSLLLITNNLDFLNNFDTTGKSIFTLAAIVLVIYLFYYIPSYFQYLFSGWKKVEEKYLYTGKISLIHSKVDDGLGYDKLEITDDGIKLFTINVEKGVKKIINEIQPNKLKVT